MKTRILTIAVLVVATLTITGCGNKHPEFIFDEKIGDEHVKFEQPQYMIGIVSSQKKNKGNYSGNIPTYKDFLKGKISGNIPTYKDFLKGKISSQSMD